MSLAVRTSLLRQTVLHASRRRLQTLAYNYNVKVFRAVRFQSSALEDTNSEARIQAIASDGGASEADLLLKELAEARQENDNIQVNLDTYSAVMDSWITLVNDLADTGSADQAFEAADKAHQVLRLLQDHPVLDPTTKHYNDVLQAWNRLPRVKGVAQRSQRILEEMDRESIDPLSDVRPTLESYNTVMSTWAQSREHMRATMGQNVFREMKKYAMLEPNGESHRIMLGAWASSGQHGAAFLAARHLISMLEEVRNGSDDPLMQPTLEDYQTVLQAWAESGHRRAPYRALGILRTIENAFTDGQSDLRPDRSCFRITLLCLSLRKRNLKFGIEVDRLLAQMNERLILPDSDCYTYAIRTWVQGARHSKCKDTSLHAKRAFELLEEMESAHHRGTEVEVTSSTENYNEVLGVLSQVINDDATAMTKVKELLSKMETSDRQSKIRPDYETYELVLKALENSTSSRKVQEGSNILDRVKKHVPTTEIDRQGQKNAVGVFNAFIHLCASSKHNRQATFQLAVGTMETMLSLEYAKPNPETFQALLEACSQLLPMGKERTSALESVFKRCCMMGLVDGGVLRVFGEVAPEDLFNEVVLLASKSEEDTKIVPEAWTRNLESPSPKLHRKLTQPLSVDLGHMMTMEMAEKRMKKRRAKQERNLLKGGRIQTKP